MMVGQARARREGWSGRVLWRLVSLGLTPRAWPGSGCGTAILEVRGRRSGRLDASLVTWVEHEGVRYLVSMPGRAPGWVRNMRAAGGRVGLRHGGRRDEVRLEELPVNRRAPVLQAWYRWTSLSAVPRRHFRLDRRAPLEEFARLAPEHPVFRIVFAEASEVGAGVVGHVTRDVTPAMVGHLLHDPPRATVGFVDGGEVEVLAATVRADGDDYSFGIAAGAAPDLSRREVLLLMDGGSYWFELCGISVRGVAERIDPPRSGTGETIRWYAVVPQRVLAWDYGAVREE